MPTKCKDKYGNYVDCETLKALKSENWRASDDASKGTEMRSVYKPKKVTSYDPNVYDRLQKEIDSGFAEAKYGFIGTDLNEYIKAKNTQTEYRSSGPSKNEKQNEDLTKINKKGADISTVTGITPRDIEIPKEEDTQKETTIKQGEGKTVKIKTNKGKSDKPKGRRSLFNSKSKLKTNSSRRSLYKCPKKGCVAKGERSIQKQLKKNR